MPAAPTLSGRPRRNSREGSRRAAARPTRARDKRGTRPKPTPRPLRKIVVLVVEDHGDTREMLGQMLESLGAQVLLAPDAQAAQVVLAMERPHIILLDLMLPGVDGLSFSRHIQSDPRLADIPIVAVTALSHLGDYIQTWTRGFAGHLAKPVEETVLTDAILRVTRRGR